MLRSRTGEWWVVTGTGILRYAASDARDLPRARRLPGIDRTTLGAERFRTIFEDARGDLWIGLLSQDGRTALARWERRPGRVHRYTTIEGVTPFAEAVHFVEDSAGQLWVGFRDGTLARHREGTWFVLRTEGRLPGLLGIGRPMIVDRQRRLWLAFRLGVALLDSLGYGPDVKPSSDGTSGGPTSGSGTTASGARTRMWRQLEAGRQRLADVLAQTPKELRLAVNGVILSNQQLTSAVNRLTLRLTSPARDFVEVFSEQDVRLIMLTLAAPPSGPVEVKESAAFNDGRRLDVRVSFAAAAPVVHASYVDPRGAATTSRRRWTGR